MSPSTRRNRWTSLTPWLFLLPALIFYVVFLVYPVLSSFRISLTDWDGLSADQNYVGIANFQKIFTDDPVARTAFTNNLKWTAFVLLVPTLVGLVFAIFLNSAIRGRTFFRSVFYLPAVLPMVGVGIIWRWMYNPNFGAVNQLLQAVGLEQATRPWLGDFTWAFPAVMLTAVWGGIGFPMLLYLAGLQAIPQEQYEAAKLDGAGPIQSFFTITLPLLKESHIIVISLAIIGSFNIFDLIFSLTYGGPGQVTQVLGTWMYFNTFQYFNAGYGTAIAWVIAAIAMIVTIPYLRIMSKR